MNEKIRSQFPFLKAKPTPIYLDNASTTQKPQCVLDALIDFYQLHCGNPGRGDHWYSQKAERLYESSREAVANFIHAQSNEIIFTRNTTESINALAQMSSNRIQANDVILTTQAEHHSNLLPWIKLAQQKQARLEYIPVNRQGVLEWQSKLEELKKQPVKILSLAHVSNVLGAIHPVRKIIEQAQHNWPGVITMVDAAQSIAHLPMNVDQLKCDFLVFSGHKVYGPMGIGVLYGRKNQLNHLPPFLVGGGMVTRVDWHTFQPTYPPARFEAGTVNAADAVGLGTALEWLERIKMEKLRPHEQELTAYLLDQLARADINGLTLLGSSVLSERIGIVSLTIDNLQAEDLANYLDDDHIMVRAGHHCAMPLHQDVLKIGASLRISLGIYNTQQEIDQLMESLKKAVKLLRD